MRSYRTRIASLVFAFLLIAGGLSGLVVYVINSFESTLDSIYLDVTRDMQNDRFVVNIHSLALSARKYVESGNDVDRNIFLDQRREFQSMLSSVELSEGSASDLRALRESLGDYLMTVDAVAAYGGREGTAGLSQDNERLDESEDVVENIVMTLHFDSMHMMAEKLRSGHAARAVTSLYIYGFITFCLVSCAFLLVYMRRTVEEPTDIILEATGRVSSGDLGYRIEAKRSDEFGLIFNRFNHMVESLDLSKQTVERRLDITQLILAIGTLSSRGQSLPDVLTEISSLVSDMLSREIFAIFVHDREAMSYNLTACLKSPEAMEGAMRFVEDSSLVRRITETRAPFVLQPGSADESLGEITGKSTCLLVAPSLHEDEVVGFVVMGATGDSECSTEEIDTARVIATTVGVMIRNHTLHEETTARLSQLSTVFELAKEITSLYEPKELLDTIAHGVAELIHSRGCIIRIKEGESLVPKSTSGEGMGSFAYEPVPVGKGVPGWVASNGRPMVVDDMDELSDEMKFQVTARKTALVVPMIKDDVIIGTLGIVDRIDAEGQTVKFSKSDMRLAEGFASISALAIDKALTHEHGILVSAEMEKTEKRMGMLFDNVQVGIITLDENYTIKTANKYVERWADMSAEDMLLKDARDVFHKDEDESFICPHCAARPTFEEGGVYSVNMNKGLNYAELASYPLRDEDGRVNEAIVVIQDTTARVLYEEDIMGLYREVMQANEYIESLIKNSADAIVTTDLKGTVQTWNPAAEEIYGYRSSEVTGGFLPYVPDGEIDSEHEYIERIRKGDVLKLESFRIHRDGGLIESSMTLSPIKDISGEIIGISHISRSTLR